MTAGETPESRGSVPPTPGCREGREVETSRETELLAFPQHQVLPGTSLEKVPWETTL